MRIAFVARVPHTQGGGVRNVIENLAQGLRLKGHWVEILLGGTKQRWTDFWLFPLRILIRSYRNRWDLVIAHSADGVLCALGGRLTRRFPPVIMHSHGWEETAFESWLKMAGPLGFGPKIRNKIIARLLRFPFLRLGLRHSRRAVFVSAADRTWAQAAYPEIKDKFVYLPNGYNSGVFSDTPCKTERETSILFQGNWTWKKGHFLLVRILCDIMKARNDTRVNLAGTNLPPKDRERIFGGLPKDRISFFENLTPQAMANLYRRSGLLLHLSLYEGGIPCLTLLEAMACGLPIVAFAYRGLESFLLNEKEAILVPPGDAGMATQKAIELLGNPQKRKKLAKAGLEKVKNFTWANAVNQWEEILKETAMND